MSQREIREVTLGLSDVINNDFEGLLDLFDERGWPGEGPIMDINYRVLRVSDNGMSLIFQVEAEVMEDEDDEA